MNSPRDPFSHHPELREEIIDPDRSFFRTFNTDTIAGLAREHGLPVDWWHSDETREALRAKALADHDGNDLWIFAYGSLMWDPAFRFTDVRYAWVPGYARRFILRTVTGGRGTAEAPGLMAALDKGPGCRGLAFRIAREDVDRETEILWRREQIGPAYIATFVDAVLSDSQVRALTFLADHDAPQIENDLTHEQQVHYLSTGSGFLGSSRDYLENVARHFSALGIEDDEVNALLRDVRAYSTSD